MDAGAPLVANVQAPEVMQSGQRALHYPTVAAQALRRLDPAPGNEGHMPWRRSWCQLMG